MRFPVIFTLVMGLVPGSGVESDKTAAQKAIIAKLKKLGNVFVKLDHEARSRPIIGVELHNLAGDNADRALEIVKDLSDLRELRLGAGDGLTIKGMKCLARMRTLEVLDLYGGPAINAGLTHIKALTKLKWLSLSSTNVDDAALESLKVLTSLEHLDLSSTKVTAVGLQHLAGLDRLTTLYLDHTVIGDAGLGFLADLHELEWLSLARTRVGNAGLEHLNGLTKMRSLSLESTRVTDTGLRHLAFMIRLERLDLWKTEVTEKGAKRLEEVLPKLTVVHSRRGLIADQGW